MARKPVKQSFENVDIEVKAQPGKQTLAMDLMPEVMIYGGAAGCVSAETEYLTRDGWKQISEYDGEDIYQYNPRNKRLELVTPSFVEYDAKDNLYCITNGVGVFQELSMEHRFVFYKKKNPKNILKFLLGILLHYSKQDTHYEDILKILLVNVFRLTFKVNLAHI